MPFSPPSPYQGHLWANRTVGLLGGSFNPAHSGHRHISLHALKSLQLDAVWWMVSPQNPLKSTHGMATLESRIISAQKVSHHPKIVVTSIEQELGTRYTADTLRELQKRFLRTTFIWIMGTDNLQQVHRWEQWEEIFTRVPVCVLDRPPRHDSVKTSKAFARFHEHLLDQELASSLKAKTPPAWTILHIPLDETSSTAIRSGKLRKTGRNDMIKE